MSTGLMQGKRGLIMGLANDKSIAWGIAQAVAAQGAELAFSYQGEALKKRVEPLAESLGQPHLYECDVASDESIDPLFTALKAEWGQLDFLVHAIVFSDSAEKARSLLEDVLTPVAPDSAAERLGSVERLSELVSPLVDRCDD